MLGGDRIKLDKDLMARVRRCAQLAGYSSAEEFVHHLIERELAKLEEGGASEEEIRRRLQGLGYIS